MRGTRDTRGRRKGNGGGRRNHTRRCGGQRFADINGADADTRDEGAGLDAGAREHLADGQASGRSRGDSGSGNRSARRRKARQVKDRVQLVGRAEVIGEQGVGPRELGGHQSCPRRRVAHGDGRGTDIQGRGSRTEQATESLVKATGVKRTGTDEDEGGGVGRRVSGASDERTPWANDSRTIVGILDGATGRRASEREAGGALLD